MNFILLNLKNFFKNEKTIFIIMILCIVISAFILNFSYGLYYHYNYQKNEVEIDMDDLYPELVDGKTLTKEQLQEYAQALNEATLENMIVICGQGKLSEFPENENGWPTFYSRFVIHDGEYDICEVTRDAWQKQGRITSGRYISSDEEANGASVALVYALTKDNWGEESLNIRNDDGTITLFGKKYEVIGTYDAGGHTPIVPFLSIPDDYTFFSLGFSFKNNITLSIFNDLKSTADRVIPGTLLFPELELPDSDDIAIYNNMIVISFAISTLAVVNIAMLYHYVVTKRRKCIAIMRMCGCTIKKATLIHLGECALITIPSYVAGTLLNTLLVKIFFGRVFLFMEIAYTPAIPYIIFAIFICVFVAIMLTAIFFTLRRTITDEWKER